VYSRNHHEAEEQPLPTANMTCALSLGAKNTHSILSILTEENLRAHRCAPINQQQSTCPMAQQKRTQSDNCVYELDEDEDEHSIALRRVASLQALKAYGGCFASGFLAMQHPFPWTTAETTSIRTSSSGSSHDSEYPGSDLETESIVSVQEIETGRRRPWKRFGRSRASMAQISRE